MLKKVPVLFILLLICAIQSLAQSVGVQVTVLPPYQINLADYRSRPGQVVIILTNLTRSQQNIQLTGSIIGDNGVSIIAKPGYISNRPVVLEPNEVKRVSAEEVSQLFDVNAVDLRNVNLKEMARTGMLPEGMYQICIQALQYRTFELLSSDQGGCSNVFPVQSLEPPVVIKPMQDEELNALSPQNILFTWSTPPSAPPGIEYVFKMVELLADNRNPNDAILSNTGINAFEEVVRSNSFLYGPSYAPLVEGRRYAIQVTARSPFNNAVFRNAGKSEVVVFTYGAGIQTAKNTPQTSTPEKSKTSVKYASHVLKGKLLWAFKESEEQAITPKLTGSVASVVKNDQNKTFNQNSINTAGIQTAVAGYYSGNNTLQMLAPVSAAKADPTLSVSQLLNFTASAPAANEFISSTGAEELSYTQAVVSGAKSKVQYPLSGVTVTIRAEKNNQVNTQGNPVKTLAGTQTRPVATNDKLASQMGLRTVSSLADMLSSGSSAGGGMAAVNKASVDLLRNSDNGKKSLEDVSVNQPVLLATGTTDNEGNYSIQFIHPEYEGLNTYTHLVIAVKTDDFEEKEFRIPVSDLDLNETIDLGTYLLAAKTYRYIPVINLEKPAGGFTEEAIFKVNIYRPVADLQNFSYLAKEGMDNKETSSEKTISGRKMRLVSSQQVTVKQNGADATGQPARVFSKLFYNGKLYVEVEPVKANYQRRELDLAVQDIDLAAKNILEVNARYLARLVAPSVSGQVIAKGGSGMEPISNAIVKISFKPEDVEIWLGGPAGTGVIANTLRTTQLSEFSTGGKGNGAAPSNNNIGLFAAASLNSNSGLATPVLLNNNSINAGIAAVIPADIEKDYGAYTARTDASGQFYIGNLPVLKEGKSYTLSLVELPKQYQDMELVPASRQHTFIIARGEQVNREFVIKPEIFQLVGRVVTKEGKPLPFARLHFQGSSNYFDAGESGLFETSYFAGNHTLIIEKPGYMNAEVKVSISKNSQAVKNGTKENLVKDGKISSAEKEVSVTVLNIGNSTQLVEALKNSPTVQKAGKEGYTFSPALFGHATPDPVIKTNSLNGNPAIKKEEENTQLITSFVPIVVNNFRGLDIVEMNKELQDLGDVGHLVPKTARVLFKVEDKISGKAIAGVTISLFDTSNTTNATGIWKYEGLGGQTTIRITPPPSSGYISSEVSMLINETGVENNIVLKIEKGLLVTGKVLNGDKPISGATITPEGFEYAKVNTDNSGSFQLWLPAGNLSLKASRSGYISKTEEVVLAVGKENIVNFILKDGGNKKISHLLGFEIELEKAVAEANGELWTGRFVNLKPVSSVFSVNSGSSLAFTNVRVSFDANGNPVPLNNEVQTDELNLAVKLFGYLPLTFTSNGGLKVKSKSDGKGYIAGSLKLAANLLPDNKGFAWPETGDELFVIPNNETVVNDVRLFSAETTSQQVYEQFKFILPAQSSYTINLYGFKAILDLSLSKIYSDRLQLGGTLNTTAIGPVAALKFTMQELVINKNWQVQSVKIKSDNLPKMDIAGWSAELHSLIFNEGRFKLGGKLSVSIPSSGKSDINFSDLSLMSDALYGGKFSLPENGLNLMNIVKLKTKNEPLHFGRVGNTNVYSLNGSASIQFDKFITQKIEIPLFQVQTDGRFMVEAPANFKADVGFAKLAVHNIILNTVSGQTPSIGVIGEFKADLDMLKFSVGDIRFKARSGGGTEFSVSKIAAELDVPVFKAGLTLGIKDNGFEGTGSLGIPATPINADIAFHYLKNGNNLDIAASFKTGVIIPLGIVTIEKVGGGFRYQTEGKKFMVNINGAASITGLSNLVRLNPISLTVESGPVIRGSADLEVVSYFKMAKSEIVLNIPGKQFAVTVSSDIEPIKGLQKAQMKGLFRLSWDPSNPYAFLGCGMNTNLLGIFNSYGNFALGINIKNPYTRNDDIGYFFNKLDKDLAGSGVNTFSGVYVHTGFQIGNPGKKYGFDISVASAQFWYSSGAEAMLLCNFANNGQYRMRLRGDLSAGADLCAVKLCVGASFNACYGITGGRNETDGWYINGNVAGAVGVKIGGCNPSCNDIDTCWEWPPAGARICANAQAHIKFSQKDGWQLNASAGGDPSFNGCNK